MGETAPTPQGLVLFEHYERRRDGTLSLLIVTSDATLLVVEDGDVVVRRPWATAAPAEETRLTKAASGE